MSSGPPDLIVVGDVMLDVTVRASALARGGDVHGRVRIRPGGTGTNAAVWAATRSRRVRLFGRVGNDLAGRLLTEEVRARGVEALLGADPEAPTGSLLVIVQDGERSMVADRGANARLSPAELPPQLDAGAVLVSGYLLFHPASEPAARAALARASARVIAVDAASWPLIDAFGAEAFLRATAGANLLLANDREAEALTGHSGEQAARELAARYGAAAVKLGEEGAILAGPGGVHRARTDAPSSAPDADPTGAGDAFDGVLLAELAGGTTWDEALLSACRAGASVAAGPDTWPSS